MAISKPDLGGGISHPARFSMEIIPVFAKLLKGYPKVLDPFAGTGRIHLLEAWGHETWGVEIEPEWAALHPRTIVANALYLPFPNRSFDAGCSSPAYSNRLSDHHNARDGSLRRSYRHDLGRPLHPDNTGGFSWIGREGERYRALSEAAWAELGRVLRHEGRFVLNVKNHIRGGTEQDVVGWHLECCQRLGFVLESVEPVATRHLRQGENTARCVEQVAVMTWKGTT